MTKSSYDGVVLSPTDVRDYRIAAAGVETFPEEYSIEPLVAVKNQGGTPSCVAHAASTIVEWQSVKETGNYTEFSTEFIYGYRPNGYFVGNGMCLRDACKTLNELGDVPTYKLPGNHNYETAMQNVEANFESLRRDAYANHITKYIRLESTHDIMHALMNYGPVLICMKWYDKSRVNTDGIYIYDSDVDYGLHAVVIYGWTEFGWLVQNSWGSGWGKQGRFVLPFGFKIEEAWGIVDNYHETTEDDFREPFKSKLGSLLAKLFNWIANAFRRSRKN